MRIRSACAFALLLAVPGSGLAASDDDEGVPVRITVVDPEERPIPHAWVRVPDTEGGRLVDPETGVWEARYLYAYDGMEIFFERGMTLEFTISAPGHATRVARYKIRGGKNQLTVVLPDLDEASEEADTNVTWFRRTPTRPPEPRPEPEPTPPADPAPSGGPGGR